MRLRSQGGFAFFLCVLVLSLDCWSCFFTLVVWNSVFSILEWCFNGGNGRLSLCSGRYLAPVLVPILGRFLRMSLLI